ncbi:tripartite tricarboxylate transporter TctB family protein [Pseudonocardia nematodicida]|uniref:Tripartite tricarboxylate transporter TctB family protein n=1 Tax=Pseudonocardia nematodicida TaxID=1206997 RepID=A0ABV1KDU2_9PSEU
MTGSVLILLAVAALVHLFSLDVSELNDDPGPHIVPGLAAAGLGMSGLAMVVRPGPSGVSRAGTQRHLTAGFLAVVVGYVGLLGVVGYYIATPAFIITAFWLFSTRTERVVLPAVITAALVTVAVGLIFNAGLGVVLPEGVF